MRAYEFSSSSVGFLPDAGKPWPPGLGEFMPVIVGGGLLLESTTNGCEACDMLPGKSKEGTSCVGPAVVVVGTVPGVGVDVVVGGPGGRRVPIKRLGSDCDCDGPAIGNNDSPLKEMKAEYQ